MSTPFAPDDEPRPGPARFQFNLRMLLVLTALTAWLFGWSGAVGIVTFVLLAVLGLIEAGCTPGSNVLGVLVRNLFAYFVCSLAFGAVGFGVMYGSNPTGWFGTDQFLFAPLFAEEAPEYPGSWDSSDPQDVAAIRASELPRWLQAGTVFCTMVVVVAHRVLVGRGGPAAYVVFWIVMATLVYPLLGCWTAGALGRDEGWLFQLGFGSRASELFDFGVLQITAAGAVLAGVLVLHRCGDRGHRCLRLQAPYSHRWLVRIGLSVPCLFFAVAPIAAMLLSEPLDGPPGFAWTPMVIIGAAASAALITSLPWQRRACLPLVLGAGFAGTLTWLGGAAMIGPLWGAAIGGLAGVLVVAASWLLERLRVDDPGGAVAVHGIGGAMGVLCAGLLIPTIVAGAPGWTVSPRWDRPWAQLFGIAVCFAWGFGASVAVFCLMKCVPGLVKRQGHNEMTPRGRGG